MFEPEKCLFGIFLSIRRPHSTGELNIEREAERTHMWKFPPREFLNLCCHQSRRRRRKKLGTTKKRSIEMEDAVGGDKNRQWRTFLVADKTTRINQLPNFFFSALCRRVQNRSAWDGEAKHKKVLEYTKHEQQNSIIIHSFRTRKPARQQRFD
jgi:hypothetical protein